MDKYEYKLRLEEIRTLNRKGRFQEAAQVADTIDWNKVRNVSTLGVISDVYKINRRFDDAKAILLLANEKSPQNRRIVYALCDLTVKMGQVVDAVEYYKEFVQLAPNDNSKYILLYKIYEAQDISLEERIAVLKEYKKREYNEKWAYELAFLYHRVGLATECVEECDQLILWFGEGKYVAKAMELKMLYAPLSPAQQQAYDRYLSKREGRDTGRQEPDEKNTVPASDKGSEAKEEKAPVKDGEMDIQVKPMDMGQYNTMNLQAALAESMKEVLGSEQEEPAGKHTPVLDAAQDGEVPGSVTRTIETDRIREAAEAVRTVAADTQTSGTDRAESESRPGERRITGQMSLEEVLAEWEKLKKDNQTKRKQETRQWMQQQTGALFEDFDHTAREGILEKLEREEPLPLEQEKEKGLEDDTLVRAVRRRRGAACFILVGYGACYVPWMLVSRLTFLYHYFPCVPFLAMAVAFWYTKTFETAGKKPCRLLFPHSSHRFWQRVTLGDGMITGLCVISVGFVILFWPVITGVQASSSYIHWLQWLPGWFFGG